MQLVVFGLTITSSWGNGHATLWRGLVRALERRGCRVIFFERDEPYYAENRDKLKALPIVNEKLGKPIEPSAETVVNGTYQPLSRPIFVYVNARSASKPEVSSMPSDSS